ncbi:eIF-2-alpha kinase activator GCN1-like [Biomphalaria glabrata]|uniref:EIF-2-alpha kinase activator GCN1-like n=1 Tax=Biomphalaria glabrata TaxID=6526 RepID=A0A9W2YFC1_BIOGL|nr:eIF-2-alpha kinase activator GCN1-like [Biomphalaria glabrata]
MADSTTSTADILKKYALKVAVSSVKERTKAINDVIDIVDKGALPEAAVKGIFHFLVQVLGLYRDNLSRHVALRLVNSVTKAHFEASVKLLTSSLEKFAQDQIKIVVPSKNSSGDCLLALSWTCIPLRQALANPNGLSGATLQQLVSLQSLLVNRALAANVTILNKATYKKLRRIWKEIPQSVDKYTDVVAGLEQSALTLPLIGLIMKYLATNKLSETIQKHKNAFLDIYLKQVIASRTAPSRAVLLNNSELLRHCTHEDFKDLILPAIQKAMLRNPETIQETVSELLSSVTLDLSQYAMDIVKLFSGQISSKEESNRVIAVQAVKNLARQCSDPGAIEKVANHLFKVLGGSEGKLTFADQKISVLQGIGNLVYNTVSGTNSLQSLSTTISEMFLPTLQQEVHEGTLVHTLSMLSLWCAKFYTDVPDKLLLWFPKGIALKTSTSAVRNAYFRCMNAAFHGDTLQQAVHILPILIQALEKAEKQPTLPQLMSEAVASSCLLIKISLVDIQADTKLSLFWNIILDSKKQYLVNEKFLSSASEDTLLSLIFLLEKLILDYPTKMTDEISRPYYRALIFCLCRRSWAVRHAAQLSTKKLLALLGGAKIALALIQEFQCVLDTQKISELHLSLAKEEESTKTEGTESVAFSKVVSPAIMASTLQTICAVEKVDQKDAEKIALTTLLPAHHPYIFYVKKDLWITIIRGVNLDPSNFVSQFSEECLSKVTTGDRLSEAEENTVSTLAFLNPGVIVPCLISQAKSILANPALFQVTNDDYGIFLTPDGELYDKAILESAMQSAGGDQNIRRENKLYSYADQMAELELRKEIEKKKGKKPQEAPKFSKKQEEQLAAQKQKESEIRERLRALNKTVLFACTTVEAILKVLNDDISVHVKDIYDSVVPLLKSPLGAPSCRNLFISLGRAAFDSKSLGNLVAHATLRLLKPACSLNPAWLEEKQLLQTSRAVNTLYNIAVFEPKDNNEERSIGEGTIEDEESKCFSGPTFCYIYYLLRCVLDNGGRAVKSDMNVCTQALKLILEHAKMRRTETDIQAVDVYDPDLLPRKQMLEIVLRVVGTYPPEVQQLANDTLLEIARAANGDDGATEATPEEIEVLLKALQSPAATVRDIALQCLTELALVLPSMDENLEVGLSIAKHIWIVCNDPETPIQQLATNLRNNLDLGEPCEELCAAIVEDCIHDNEVVRSSAALALAQVLSKHPSQIPCILRTLLDQYEAKLYLPPPKIDEFGRQVEEQPTDMWPARSGIALALKQISPLLTEQQIPSLFSFFVPQALNDRAAEVRSGMRDAALAAIQSHGKENVNILLPTFENFLITAPAIADYDPVRQSIVILMGNLARHLDADNPKVKPIVAQLIAALSTPSQEVQEAVANCLPALVPFIKSDAPNLVSKLLSHLLDSDNYGERKGAAYGLAGLIKGMGILALKHQQVMETLTEAIQDKKNPRKREGALLAFEMLCNMLGRLFEPYIVHIIQHLLLCFGDSNQYVREAADDCAKSVMRNLSAHGVKLVLPSLLKGLEEDAWRTKAGSVELLGAMAFCAPKQLSACLPSIVPKLTEVLTDSHLKVQKAGSQALMQIGSVIRNPEIQAIVTNLLEALQEPTRKTTGCLEKLLMTKFVHFVDAPSLALIMPVIQRAFQDRTTDTRKMAAQIMGNMYSLTDQKDLSPYLPSVIPGLKQCLLDPVPEVRTVSAKALGAMVRGMGEDTFQDLLPWLMEKLVSEQSSVDRSGAAQGLSEVIGGMGEDKLKKLMNDIIQTAERSDLMSHVRDGYIMTYIYLPSVFGATFVQYVGPILPSILQALSDENEFVRDTALRAGKRIINQYAETAVELLLPELEKGLFDDNWRIRNSSVQLLGDLLYKVSGVSGKMTTETANEDDNFGTESSQQAMMKALGSERRNRVLSGLYMGRSDTALMVRQNALHVWKIIVANTPRTLREILPTLFQLLLGCLASTSHDKRTVAARTLGDLVRKLGERVLPEIIPILECGLDSPEADQRQGVCIGLSEIMASTSKDHVSVFADSLIPTVRRALIDPLPDVRSAAAFTFDNLHHNIGQRALDEILPNLLRNLNEPAISERALDGLKQVMAVKSRVVLPYLVPQLTVPPVNTQALSLLSSVAGEALTKHLGKILPALMSSLSEKIGTPDEEQELEYCKSVVLSVEDDLGVRTVMEDLLSVITHNSDAAVCTAAVLILNMFCANTSAVISEYFPQLFRGLIGLFVRSDERLLLAGWHCLDAITKKIDLTETEEHIASVRQALKFTLSDFKEKELPGFSIAKKGIAPVLPIFREGLLNGSAEVKEAAALGLGEVIAVTGAEALKPSVVNITGPLIRILGDRFAWTLKVAVLDTLSMLLVKVGVMLKPFLPQLQTTFVKAINDPNRSVRLRAASALGKLILIHTRVDSLFNELIAGFKSTEDFTIKDTFVQAIRACLQGAGSKIADSCRRQLTQTLVGLLASPEDSTRMTAAGCLGTLSASLPENELSDLMIQHLLDTDPSLDWTLRHGRSMALSVALKEAPERILTPSLRKNVEQTIGKLVAADRIPIGLSGLRAAGYLLQYLLDSDKTSSTITEFESLLVKSMKADSNDVKILVAQIISYFADKQAGRFTGDLLLVPALVMGTKEKNSIVKSCCESALVQLLKLRKGEQLYQEILVGLDLGMQDSLKEVVSRSLRKLATQPESPVDEIDDTLLK